MTQSWAEVGGTFSPFHFVSRQLPNLFLHIWDQEQFAATVYADDYGGWYVSCVLPVWSDNAVIVVGTQESDHVSPSDLRRSHIHLPPSHISFSLGFPSSSFGRICLLQLLCPATPCPGVNSSNVRNGPTKFYHLLSSPPSVALTNTLLLAN